MYSEQLFAPAGAVTMSRSVPQVAGANQALDQYAERVWRWLGMTCTAWRGLGPTAKTAAVERAIDPVNRVLQNEEDQRRVAQRNAIRDIDDELRRLARSPGSPIRNGETDMPLAYRALIPGRPWVLGIENQQLPGDRERAVARMVAYIDVRCAREAQLTVPFASYLRPAGQIAVLTPTISPLVAGLLGLAAGGLVGYYAARR